MFVPLPVGTSYKFRVVAVNVIGSSPPSAPSKAYTVVGGKTHERPVDGPYITYNEAINETTIILKWTVCVQRHFDSQGGSEMSELLSLEMYFYI